jgi:glutamate-1-semialdehyde 2,1-aminomutase
VPADVAAHWRAVPFDEPGALEAEVAARPPAAVVLEPVVVHEPSLAWLGAARAAADRAGAVLVYDEVKTGFRLAQGGAAARYGVRPDLAVLGKALANGFPLAAVVGRADLMARFRQTWVSSTLATEFVSLAAADAVLDVWAREDVAGHIARIGRRATEGLAPLAARAGAPLAGMPAMFFLRFEDAGRERRFLLALAARGVLMKRGAYEFPCLAHTDADVERTLAAVDAALREAT